MLQQFLKNFMYGQPGNFHQNHQINLCVWNYQLHSFIHPIIYGELEVFEMGRWF